MCIKCEIEDTLLRMIAAGLMQATFDGETLSTGQVENLLGTPDGERVMVRLTDRGKMVADHI